MNRLREDLVEGPKRAMKMKRRRGKNKVSQ